MKRILACLSAALFAFGANAATLLPIQLLNPAGSTSGQAIISTGASTAPAWSSINAATLGGATFASPGPIGSTTAGTGSFTTLNSVGGALNGSLGSGTPAGATLTTLVTTGLITPSSTIGIKGTTTNDNAQAGSFGEYVSNTNTAISPTNGTPFNAASLTLTAGDWDVSGSISYINGVGTISSTMNASLSLTTATQNAAIGFMTSAPNVTATTALTTRMSTPVARFSLSAPTTIFLVGVTTFSGGTTTSDGLIRARRAPH